MQIARAAGMPVPRVLSCGEHPNETMNRFFSMLMTRLPGIPLVNSTFTHGDFKAHNILIGDDGHLSGFLDWESAGWLPEYWEYTTAMRFGVKSWWYQMASWIGGNQYSRELACDVALNSLAVDSYIAF